MTSPIQNEVFNDRAFFGHPRGLAYLTFTEMWERFSFYGMRALVVLYMVQELLLPGHVENVAGMATLRNLMEAVFGPLSPQALASLVFGFYSGLVYFTPLLGAWIADRWLGAKMTVLIGVALMTAGHAAMVLEQSFLLALLLLILGSGCLKGNIAAQVGQLYRREDESRSTRGFIIFGTGINIGAVVGPLACGALAQVYGWHVGFGAAGILMLVAFVIYLAGQKHLPEQKPRGIEREVHLPLTTVEWKTMGMLFIVMGISIFQTLSYEQLFNVGIVWVADRVDLATSAGTVPATWFNSIDSFASIAITPVVIGLWAMLALHRREPSDISKIGIGAAIMALSSALLVLSASLASGGRTGPFLALIAFFLSGVAFMFQWPTLLALVSRAAPRKINARMVSSVYLTIFVADIAMGYIGTLYEKMTPTQFWLMNSGISAIGVVLVLVFRRSLNRALHRPVNSSPMRPAQEAMA